jgi:hypothetical protein
MMHCILNDTNFGIRSLFFGIQCLFSGVTDLTLIWDTVLVLWDMVPVHWDTVPVRLTYAYTYHSVFVSAIFMIYIFLVS